MGRSGHSKKNLAAALLGSGSVNLGRPKEAPVQEPVKEDRGRFDFLDSYENNDYNLPKAEKIHGSLTLIESETLVNYDSPTNKEYSGAILIGKDSSGKTVYQGVCYFGPGGKGHAQVKIYYKGDSLEEARKIVQNQLNTKINSGYSAPATGTGFDATNFLSKLPTN